MILADSEIIKAVENGTIQIEDFDVKNLRNNSYYLQFKNSFSLDMSGEGKFHDLSLEQPYLLLTEDIVLKTPKITSEDYQISVFPSLILAEKGFSGFQSYTYEDGKIFFLKMREDDFDVEVKRDSIISRVQFFRIDGISLNKFKRKEWASDAGVPTHNLD